MWGSAPAIAAEKIQVCAKYQINTGWSKGHLVNASHLRGSELNTVTKSFEYSSFSTYIVIFWDKDQATIIEMDWPTINAIGQEGTDRRGLKWEIAKTRICF